MNIVKSSIEGGRRRQRCYLWKLLFFQNNTKELDFDYFVSLFEEYYLSDDPSDLGNFINGRLEFPVEEGSDAEAEDEQGEISLFNGVKSISFASSRFLVIHFDKENRNRKIWTYHLNPITVRAPLLTAH